MDTSLQDSSSGPAGETPPVGQVLDGRYRVESRIAVGGMATVYRAVDTRLDRRLALKVMHPSLAGDSAFVDRFIREAKSVARLAHPNVVGVYDQGTDGTYVYLAMEYVSGCTLRDVLRDRGALRPRVALDVLEPMLAALGAAHHAGMVHRDMKPENVLIGDDGRVKVADFGLVRAVDSQTSVGSDTILGTVSYLAPEQIEQGTADTRTDLYACGVMFYEMLTGEKPHAGGTPAQVLYQHLHEDMPAPSAAVPGLAPELDALVARATARAADGRPQDAAAMLSETRDVRARLTAAQLDSVPPRAKDPQPGLAEVLSAGTALGEGRMRSGFGPSAGPEESTSVLPRPAAAMHEYGHGHGPGDGHGDDDLNRTARYAAPPRDGGPAHDGGPGRRRGGGRVFLVTLTAMLLLLVGTGVWYINSGQFTQTPAVLDKTESEARKVLGDSGLDVKVTRDHSERVERGHVIESNPDPGDRIRRTGTVTLVVSRGPEIVKVPGLAGTPLSEARSKLKAAGLEAGTVRQKFSEDTPRGSVIASEPDAGSERRPGSPVALTVSRGAPVDVPDVVGDDEDSATEDLREEGLKVRIAPERVFSEEDEGSVARQTPAEGSPAAEGDTVTLTISKGQDTVDVPEVEGMKQKQARKKLENAGFEVTVRKIFFGNKVFSQSPGGGDEAPRGSRVTIWLR
ncbi:serine/threonine protein kinase [Streptomyces abyssalis]|uniref:non-specific serine/threonine protein kinase n=1 Tax=Streptomyces abyssalis TaxID=933944 RepID=A0A1E7JL08_9ACTN|nr:Stk1 family PASTA domain-containing Ser/Thr kinase [Streptomyces abyssalis]OEU88312.1 serine/threonine protein kinase [Streptomyces abyssalis]OEU91182.1 serine/threonine protein kinase [Streptomyces abyssalis]